MLFSEGARPAMYHREYFAHILDHDPYARQLSEFRTVEQLDLMAQMQFVDVRAYLADDILVKVDKASMFNSLETRAPMLDQYLVEYVSSLPSTIRTRNDVLKFLLKKVAADMLPAEILNRPKQGFGVPLKHWFRDDLTGYAYELLDSPRARQRGIFNPQFIRGLLKAHAGTKLVNHSEGIWALLCLELWFQAYMDEPPLQNAQEEHTRITSKR
jgi:asparagine synthase (glutamine-hydrolysing)